MHPDDQLAISTIRCLCPDMVQQANSGHPGAPMGLAPVAHALYGKVMKYDPTDPQWLNRDRFVLSNGHGCTLQYSMLHLAGFKVTLDDLKSFRQLHSITPGHPENTMTPGIEVTTGPLGQGVCNAVGLAIASKHLAAEFNRPGFEVFDSRVFCIVGDGCMMEGMSGEACSIAGHHKLNNLVVLYDDNKITIDGDTSVAFTEDVCKRYEAYGWNTMVVEDGDHDYDGIVNAINKALQSKDKPTLIRVRTTIGYGSLKQGTEEVHGSPLGEEDIKQLKTKFGFDPSIKFNVPDRVRAIYTEIKAANVAKHEAWNKMMENYAKQYPQQYADLMRRSKREVSAEVLNALPRYTPADKPLATRKLSQKVLDAIYPKMPEFFGGSADLAISNCTFPKGGVDFTPEHPEGRYFRFGVREHAMAALCNGIAAFGCMVPFGATFHNFVSYMLGAVRLSALSHFGVLYILTHDSIGLGEDGPTHQPIETNPLLRSIPNLVFMRPADGNEVSGAYYAFLKGHNTPYAIALTRQDLPHLEGSSIENTLKGGYVLNSDEQPDVIMVATGSEVSLCLDAAKLLRLKGIKVRIVSMPSTQLFDQQPVEYRKSVLLPHVPTMSVEAASPMGWEKYAHCCFGIEKFGTSAPWKTCMKEYGFTADNVAAKAEVMMQYYNTNGFKPADIIGRPF